MLKKNWPTLLLLALLIMVQAQLWFGRGSLPEVLNMRSQVNALLADNEKQKLANEQLSAEVEDLRQGLEMVEDRARYELGMVKPNEIFVQTKQ